MPVTTWQVYEPGCLAYTDALALQHRLVRKRNTANLNKDLLILLEHPPVFTLGRRGGRENLRVSVDFLKKSGIPVIQAERGGNITYHGPGQLVAYLIMDLEASRMSVENLVWQLEEIMIQTARQWGVEAVRNAANRGIWVGDNKMGSIGIAIRKGITYHGLALNVNLDLGPFSWINPCGLPNVGVTSIQQESKTPSISMPSIQWEVKKQFESTFSIDLNPVGPDELEIDMWHSAEDRCQRHQPAGDISQDDRSDR